MTAAVIVLGAICILLVLVMQHRERQHGEHLLRLNDLWAEERANLVNAAKGARMPPPRSEITQTEPDEPKDLKEYASIGTVEPPRD